MDRPRSILIAVLLSAVSCTYVVDRKIDEAKEDAASSCGARGMSFSHEWVETCATVPGDTITITLHTSDGSALKVGVFPGDPKKTPVLATKELDGSSVTVHVPYLPIPPGTDFSIVVAPVDAGSWNEEAVASVSLEYHHIVAAMPPDGATLTRVVVGGENRIVSTTTVELQQPMPRAEMRLHPWGRYLAIGRYATEEDEPPPLLMVDLFHPEEQQLWNRTRGLQNVTFGPPLGDGKGYMFMDGTLPDVAVPFVVRQTAAGPVVDTYGDVRVSVDAPSTVKWDLPLYHFDFGTGIRGIFAAWISKVKPRKVMVKTTSDPTPLFETDSNDISDGGADSEYFFWYVVGVPYTSRWLVMASDGQGNAYHTFVSPGVGGADQLPSDATDVRDSTRLWNLFLAGDWHPSYLSLLPEREGPVYVASNLVEFEVHNSRETAFASSLLFIHPGSYRLQTGTILSLPSGISAELWVPTKRIRSYHPVYLSPSDDGPLPRIAYVSRGEGDQGFVFLRVLDGSQTRPDAINRIVVNDSAYALGLSGSPRKVKFHDLSFLYNEDDLSYLVAIGDDGLYILRYAKDDITDERTPSLPNSKPDVEGAFWNVVTHP